MFWINDRVGVAYECCEGGYARYTPEDDEFNVLMTSEECAVVVFDGKPKRRVTEEEALAFMRSKYSKEGASSPRE